MATQYTPLLQLALPVTGELNGTWGDVVNDNITSMVEEAIAGLATIDTWGANAHTLTTADGTTDEARCAMLVAATGSGGTAITGAGQIICPDRTKLYVLKNSTAFAVTLKTSAGTGVAVPAGDTAFLFCDGTNVNACVTTIVNGHISGNLTVDGTTTLNDTATTETILPAADNTYDLGSSGASWRNLYVDGTATIATLNVTTIDTTNIEVTNIKAKDGTAAISIADSTGAVTVSSNFSTQGNTTLGNATSDTVTVTGTVQPGVIIEGSSSGNALRITQTGAGNALVVEDSANPDSSPFVIDSSGQVLIGSATSVTGNSGAAKVQSNFLVAYSAVYNGVDTNPPIFDFLKNRDGAIVNSNDDLGRVSFQGYDGTNYLRSAQIVAQVDGTPGTNDMPGRLVFSTTADGASSPTERMRIRSDGNIGIGDAGNATQSFRIGKNLTGGTSAVSLQNSITILSGVTSDAQMYGSFASTQAASFTLTNLRHYDASQGTIGAGSTVTNQYGFVAAATLTGATNNYGFYSNIPSGTSRWNFYAAGTAANYFAGKILSGTTNSGLDGQIVASGAYGLSSIYSLNDANPSSQTFYKDRAGAIVQSGDETGRIDFRGYDGVAYNATGRISSFVDGTPGTNDMPGRLVFSTTADGASTPTERMRIASDGRVLIGGTIQAGRSFRVARDLTGSTDVKGINAGGTILSDVTNSAQMFMSSPSTEAAAFTLASLEHYAAFQFTFGAGSTVTNQMGFRVDSSLTGATNNYGFHSNIASGTGRWNFYAAGTAANYFAGRTLVSSPNEISIGSSVAAALQINSTFSTNWTNLLFSGAYWNSAAATGSTIALGKSRSSTIGSYAIVQSGDTLGEIRFAGDDGTDLQTQAGLIKCEVDGTPGTNDMPGRLVFSTTADGASSPTERMRIDSSGNVGIGTSSPFANSLDVVKGGNTAIISRTTQTANTAGTGRFMAGAYSGNLATFAAITGDSANNTITIGGGTGIGEAATLITFNTTSAVGAVNSGAERMRIDSSGNFLVNTTTNVPGYIATFNGAVSMSNGGSLSWGGRYADGYPTIAGSTNLLAFYPNGATSGEEMRLTAEGYLRLQTNGIQFNGDTAAANALDDYEEGTFTPVAVGTTTAGTGTYGSQSGRYTKVGNRVSYSLYLTWSAHTGTGNLRIQGLPYTGASSIYDAAAVWASGLALTANNVMIAYHEAGSSYVILQQYPVGGGNATNVAMDTAVGGLMLSGSYNVP